MLWVKNVAGFLAINLFFVLLALVGAGAFMLFGKFLRAAWPEGADNVAACMAVSIGAIGVAVWFGFKFMAFISRPRRRG